MLAMAELDAASTLDDISESCESLFISICISNIWLIEIWSGCRCSSSSFFLISSVAFVMFSMIDKALAGVLIYQRL